mgnify:CR=1 FL=1
MPAPFLSWSKGLEPQLRTLPLMRIAAFSDVHGNTPALRAVLEAIAEYETA